MQKNVASQKKIYFAFDSTTNLPKTGDAANITPYESIDYGSITAITDTSMTEMDATNGKGYYICDLTQGETNGSEILFTAKSSTANIVVVGAPALVVTEPPNSALLSVDSNGRVDVIKVAGTTQTARDLGASVLLSSGTGTGQVSLSSGLVSLSGTQTFNVTGSITGNLSGSVGSVTGAVGSVTGNVGGNVTGSVGSVTGLTAATVHSDLDDIQARLPAALTSDGNIKADTLRVGGTLQTAGDIPARLPAALTAGGNIKADMLAISSSTAGADALEESTEAIAYGTVDGTGATTTAFLTSALTPDSAVNDQFNGRVLIFKSDTTTANLRGQATTISDWAHTSAEIGTFTVVALTTAPATGDTFVIL